MTETPSILKAVALLNKNRDETSTNKGQAAQGKLPTALSRTALDKLVSGYPDDIAKLDLKSFLTDLFNWDGKNHVNKPLIRAFSNSIRTPRKYPQTVELTAYLVALAPMLEADQIARMYDVVSETETAFAPTLYTIAFHSNLKKAFADLSPQRIEKIALSLWKESHNGRWWNMTAGIDNNQQNQAKIAPEKLVKSLLAYNRDDEVTDYRVLENIIWSQENQDAFKKHVNDTLNQELAQLSEKFRKDLMSGIAVTPDVAIFLSAIDWLSPGQRPESPINSLLKTLVAIRDNDDSFVMPKKPNSITDMFPNFEMYLNNEEKMDFLIDPMIMQAVQTHKLFAGLNGVSDLRVITSKVGLAQNGKHMGNCTNSYANSMEDGSYALLYFKYNDKEYNAALHLSKSAKCWNVGEVNTRFNNGGVDKDIRQALSSFSQKYGQASDYHKGVLMNKKKRADARANYMTYRYIL